MTPATGRLHRSAARQGLALALQRTARAELARKLAAQFERSAATGLALGDELLAHHLDRAPGGSHP